MTGGDSGGHISDIDRDCCIVYQSRAALILNLDSEGKDWGGLEIKSCRICHRDIASVVNGKGTAGVAGRDRIDVGVTRIRIGDRNIANRGTIGAVLIQAKHVIIDHRRIIGRCNDGDLMTRQEFDGPRLAESAIDIDFGRYRRIAWAHECISIVT